MSEYNKLKLRTGQKVIVDRDRPNRSVVTIQSFTPNEMFATVKAIDDSYEWQTMTSRLSSLEILKEYILCAANYYNDNKKHTHTVSNIEIGFVVCGRRHYDCINTFAMIVGFPYSDEANIIRNTEEQGFITNTNRFVDRKEAYKIAFSADQIKGPNKGRSENSIGLTSEDLY